MAWAKRTTSSSAGRLDGVRNVGRGFFLRRIFGLGFCEWDSNNEDGQPDDSGESWQKSSHGAIVSGNDREDSAKKRYSARNTGWRELFLAPDTQMQKNRAFYGNNVGG